MSCVQNGLRVVYQVFDPGLDLTPVKVKSADVWECVDCHQRVAIPGDDVYDAVMDRAKLNQSLVLV